MHTGQFYDFPMRLGNPFGRIVRQHLVDRKYSLQEDFSLKCYYIHLVTEGQ
jgi:hypothetical protein